MDPRDRLVVALDTPSLADAEAIADRLEGVVRWFKIGPPLFIAAGPVSVAALSRRGRVFLDLKFHDIPSTVAAGVDAAARLGASLCTVHALGGTAMMRAAREAAETGSHALSRGQPGQPRPEQPPLQVVGVTLLTSADAAALEEMGIVGSPREIAVRLAGLARDAGMAGAVASPLEAAAIRATCGPGFLIVCPGIRPEGTASADQRRVETPRAAIAAGADLLVVGRPVTQAKDPRQAAEAIVREIAGA